MLGPKRSNLDRYPAGRRVAAAASPLWRRRYGVAAAAASPLRRRRRGVGAAVSPPRRRRDVLAAQVATLRERDLNVTTRNLVLTNGEAGGICYNPLTKKPRPPEYVCEREERAYLRRQEMVAAGAVLGTDTVWRGGFQDGMLVGVHEGAVRERIAAYIRAFKPHIIVTHYPEPNFLAPPTCNGACVGANRGWDDLGYHPDHKSAGRHVLDAAYVCCADSPRTGRGGAAAATWIVRGDGSRRRRGRDVDSPWRWVAATPRLRRG